MNKALALLISFTLSSTTSLALTESVFADDIEIYTAQTGSAPSADFQPNILFILDTSGSMKRTGTSNMDDGASSQDVIDGYDPTVDYLTRYAILINAESAGSRCRSDRIYRTDDITKPGRSCSDSSSIPMAQFRCQTGLNQIASRGAFSDKAGEFFISTSTQTRKWQNITSESNGHDADATRWVDCQSDRGIHGYDTGDTNKYMTFTTTGPDARVDLQGYGNNPAYETNWPDLKTYYFFSGNYLAYYNYETRMEVMREALREVVEELSIGNIGLMRFSSSDPGGMVIHEVANIADARSSLISALDTYLVTDGATPLAETLYEAYNYYTGSRVDYGDEGIWTEESGHPNRYASLDSVAASRLADDRYYKSPIVKECQNNYVVYLSDGLADNDDSADDEINEDIFDISDEDDWACDTDNGDNCLDELAQWMYEQDMQPEMEGTQNVITHTIAFGIDSADLRTTAEGAGGRYFTARNARQLKDALVAALQEVVSEAATFSAPAVSVNAFNRLTHRDELYFTVFEPSLSPVWQGNLKKFKLKKDGSGRLFIADANNAPALSELTGLFFDETQSYWSATADGNHAPKGGVASKMNAFTATPGISDLRPRTYLDGNPVALSDDTNEVYIDNTLLTKALLGIDAESDAYRQNLIAHIFNYDVTNRFPYPEFLRKEIGDPLHTEAVAVSYSNEDVTIFVSTNEGVLHGFSAGTGLEQVSYMPQELLPKQRHNFDPSTTSNKVYGLDGGITTWVRDGNDGQIDTGSGDFVRLIAGMRRGGRNYYAIDVSDRANPKFMYHIRPTDAGSPFAELGQTWSRPKLATINDGGTVKPVLVFGGGYDPQRDTYTNIDSASEDTLGRAIYIVEAATGSLIWSGSSTAAAVAGYDTFDEMDFSIPSEVTILDMNSDGLHDRMYVGDMGGQIWRFDIDNSGVSGASLVDGGVIAKLGQTAAGAIAPQDARRFFYPVDVSLHVDKNGTTGNFLNLAVGSGLRPNPLNLNVQDRIFVLRDFHIYDAPENYLGDYGISDANLFNTTANLIRQGSSDEQVTAATALNGSKGWFINLRGENNGLGEKILAKSITFDNKLIFSSFLAPGTYTPSSCGTPIGRGRVYTINIADGSPVIEQGSDNTSLTTEDRFRRLQRSGIPPQPTIMFPDAADGRAHVVTGTDIDDVDNSARLKRTYWMKEE